MKSLLTSSRSQKYKKAYKKGIILKKKHNPDKLIKEKIPLRVDSKTIIYINPGEDKEKAKQDYLKALEFAQQRLTKNYRPRT